MSTVFADNTSNPEVVTPPAPDATNVEELKKQVAALAKAKEHADSLIESLTRQTAEMREDMSKLVTPDEILAQIKTLQTKNTEGDGAVIPQAINPEEVSRLVEETVAKREAAQKADANVMRVDEEVRKQFGEKSKEFVADKAKELGLTLQELGSLAARSPEAFFNLVGLKVAPKAPNTDPSRSIVNTVALGNSPQTVEGTFKWYQELRQKDRKAYYDPKTQQKMMADAKRLGNAFYQ